MTWIRKKLENVNEMLEHHLLRRPEPRHADTEDSGRRVKSKHISGFLQIGEETSTALIGSVFDAIARGDHVLLIGPRGSGKSYAARKAINLAETHDNQGKPAKEESVLVPRAQVTAQGNKELPRDYFFEPEIQFEQNKRADSRGNGQNGDRSKNRSLEVKLRQPPLLHCAEEDETGQIKLTPVDAEANGSNMLSRWKPTLSVLVDEKLRRVEKFVFFLDEINRFNDGVLDSLLLLLEEKCIVYQGRLIELNVVVVATMNPPGYDMSARSLSPPLMSRFNMVKHLYTAGPVTLTSVILPEAVGISTDRLRVLMERHFAVAVLTFWGGYDPKRPSSAYLSPDSWRLLSRLTKAAGIEFDEHLNLISTLSNYGPDARATRDWILAVDRRIQGEMSDLPLSHEIPNEFLAVAAIQELSSSVGNKLVLNFSPEAQPDKFKSLMNALGSITYEIFMNEKINQIICEEIK